MTPKERAVKALTLQIPDYVPTFELEFQLEDIMFGKKFLHQEDLKDKSPKEREKLIKENAEYMLFVYEELEYSIIPIHYLDLHGIIDTARYIRKMSGDKFMLTTHGDGTFAIPDGNEMYEFAYAIADDPEGVKQKAENMALEAIERNKKLADAGFDCLILCSDYCYNSGPFLSPAMFKEYIQPYLYKIIDEAKKCGMYTIKHTDGNIMPILDQLVECRPDAIHSIDPMAKVDIKEVKRLIGDKVCLCGNVNCALMQTGTDEEVIESAEYCLTHGKPNGGYIFCTSNIPFAGLPVERYKLVLDVWKKLRYY
ncbi:uroporphyrinogen decarboxylase [Caloramator quimbayensis]|uniref:Uroporphyrinogen decarboxylase n=1 Tax=Caloramator quimbayensis TaxID=1147123 RepID=A0A1T4WFW4_9CLOT|nr:uroporphyrinogen decarboxylase family protein [Caloramator quimbayensis]SKA76087.1 uroporphyrinogen decarboxylase [Caloramator quimbayensis]